MYRVKVIGSRSVYKQDEPLGVTIEEQMRKHIKINHQGYIYISHA